MDITKQEFARGWRVTGIDGRKDYRVRYNPVNDTFYNSGGNVIAINAIDAERKYRGTGLKYVSNPFNNMMSVATPALTRQRNLIRSGNYVIDPFSDVNKVVGINTVAYQRLVRRVALDRTVAGNVRNQNALQTLRRLIPEYDYQVVRDPTTLTIKAEFFIFALNLHFLDLETYIREKVALLGARLNVPNAKFAILVQHTDVRGEQTRQSYHYHDINRSIRELIQLYVDSEENYDDNYDFTLLNFQVKILHLREDAQRGTGGKSLKIAKKLWKITSFSTIVNCFYQNIIFLNGNVDEEKRPLYAAQLKKNSGMSGHDSVGYEDIVKISNKKNYNFKIYDNNFNLMWDVKPVEKVDKRGRCSAKESKSYEMQLRNGHFLALQRWSDIGEEYSEECVDIVEVEDVDKKIVKLNSKKTVDKKDGTVTWDKVIVKEDLRIVCWDLEATPYKTMKDLKKSDKSIKKSDDFKPFLAGFAYYEGFVRDGKVVFKQFKGENCIKDMFDFVYSNPETFKNTTWYAHNGGSFDLPIAIKYGLLDSKNWYLNGRKAVELNNSWINFPIQSNTDKDFKITFKDSLRMLPASLKSLCASFKVDVPKMDLDHDKVSWENWESFYGENNGYEYHKVDCTSLLEIMSKFSRTIYDVAGINLTACMTGASLAKKTYFKNFYKNDIFSMSKKHDHFIRKSFFGGRCEAHYLGELPLNKIFYYDFTSLHPASGLEYLPKGETIEYNESGMSEWRKKDPKMKKFFGFIRCIVYSKDTSILPLHGHRVDGKLVFAHYPEGQEMTLTSPEVVAGLASGMYEYKFLEGYQFDKGKVMAKFFSEYFEMKKKAGMNKEHALKYALKIIINSAYGFWGLNTEDRDGLFLHDNKEQFDVMMSQEKVKSWGTIGEKYFVRGSADLPISDFNVGISSFISSYSRIKIWELMRDIKAKGGEVYYCDTDSVICNFNLREDKEMMDKYCPDGKGLTLGSLKNEAEEKVEEYFDEKYGKNSEKSKEMIKKQLESDSGEFCFDKGVVLGCKFYALRKSMIDGGSVEIMKCKGYNQSADTKYGNTPLSWEKFVGLAEELKSKGEIPLYKFKKLTFDNTIEQQQKQWLRPKSNFTNENNHLGINLKNITKKFNPIYTKGLYNHITGFIEPLVYPILFSV